jgi:hypothetical protein
MLRALRFPGDSTLTMLSLRTLGNPIGLGWIFVIVWIRRSPFGGIWPRQTQCRSVGSLSTDRHGTALAVDPRDTVCAIVLGESRTVRINDAAALLDAARDDSGLVRAKDG